jgi:hypothetical protein
MNAGIVRAPSLGTLSEVVPFIGRSLLKVAKLLGALHQHRPYLLFNSGDIISHQPPSSPMVFQRRAFTMGSL